MNNKTVALVALAPFGIFFVLGYMEGVLGYPDGVTILPALYESIISGVSVLLTLFALYRLYNAPDNEG